MKRLIILVVMAILFVATPALAVSGSSREDKNKESTKSVNLSCMQSAVETRDNALATAWNEFGTTMKAALEDRRDTLKTAWGLADADARRTAIKEAWNEFRTERKNARNEFNQDRKNAWSEFKTDRKECGISTRNNGDEKESDDSL